MLESLNAIPFGWVVALIGFGALLGFLLALKGGLPSRLPRVATPLVRPRPAADVPAGHELGEAKRTIDARIEKRLADLEFEKSTLEKARGEAA